MKLKTLFMALVLSLSLTACHTPETKSTPPQQATAITCISKLERSLDFAYDPEKAIKWVSDDYKVSVYMITTTDDKQIILNSLELENYNCK